MSEPELTASPNPTASIATDRKGTRVTITHEQQKHGGKYLAHIEEENAIGHLEWEPGDSEGDEASIRVATHTIVPKSIGGRGIAGLLVKRLIQDAREQGFRIAPQCWYVAKKFDENPDWVDLRA